MLIQKANSDTEVILLNTPVNTGQHHMLVDLRAPLLKKKHLGERLLCVCVHACMDGIYLSACHSQTFIKSNL